MQAVDGVPASRHPSKRFAAEDPRRRVTRSGCLPTMWTTQILGLQLDFGIGRPDVIRASRPYGFRVNGFLHSVGTFFHGDFVGYGTAVGTVGLALVTTLALRSEVAERRELRAERDQARAETKRLEDEKAAEAATYARGLLASGISCHIGPTRYDPEIFVDAGDGGVPIEDAVIDSAVIRNMSDQAIRRIDVHWQNNAGPEPPATAAVETRSVDFVPAHGIRVIRQPGSLASWGRNQLALLISFDDANGVRWSLRDNGQRWEIQA
jgi:hypothetical protein